MPLELDSLASVRRFVEDFLAMQACKSCREHSRYRPCSNRLAELPLHCLVLNAGVMALPQETVDGHEYQLAVNYLGHFLLANLLVDHMAATASPRDPGRIISLSSSAHLIPSALQRGDLSDLQSASKYAPWQAYGQAKLCNLLFAYELDRRCRFGGIPIASNAIHPGAVATELKRHLPQNQEEDKGPLEGVYQALKSVVQPLLDLIVQSPEEGARTTVLLATSEQGKLSGYYWQDGRPSASLDTEVQGLLPPPLRALRILSRLLKAVAPPEKAATSYDTETWRDLWRESERLVGLEASEKPSAFAGPP
ncbi:TIC32 [Symbiodinium sp. CCMP2592]|nr:TIC32 [Symbiodinium sp. CCMP2592]